MSHHVSEAADRILEGVAEQENGVPGVVAMATDKNENISTKEPPESATSAKTML